MQAMLEAFQAEAGGVGAGAGRKFSAAAIARGGDYARGRRGEGASWDVIAGELGVGPATAKRWAAREAVEEASFRSVRVVERAGGTLVATLPGGLRIEGLDVASVAALVRALS